MRHPGLPEAGRARRPRFARPAPPPPRVACRRGPHHGNAAAASSSRAPAASDVLATPTRPTRPKRSAWHLAARVPRREARGVVAVSQPPRRGLLRQPLADHARGHRPLAVAGGSISSSQWPSATVGSIAGMVDRVRRARAARPGGRGRRRGQPPVRCARSWTSGRWLSSAPWTAARAAPGEPGARLPTAPTGPTTTRSLLLVWEGSSSSLTSARPRAARRGCTGHRMDAAGIQRARSEPA